mmetsp:Transcript_70766/g.229915  ORF Transcript_70766/g.229915 Transcript_70766/m.229915 type:complete len:364 (-) Transcript_70766:250-1341(-)
MCSLFPTRLLQLEPRLHKTRERTRACCGFVGNTPINTFKPTLVQLACEAVEVSQAGPRSGRKNFETKRAQRSARGCAAQTSEREFASGNGRAHLPQHLPRGLVGEGLFRLLRLQHARPRHPIRPIEVAALHVRAAAASEEWHGAVLPGLPHVVHEECGEGLAHATVLGGAHLKVRGGETWVRHQRLHLRAVGGRAVAQSIGVDQVGELRLLVARPAGAAEGQHAEVVAPEVATVLLQVLLVQRFFAVAAAVPGAAAVVHDAGLASAACGLLKERPNLGCQQVVREMVRLHLGVTTVLCRLILGSHDARIVAQNIEPRAAQLLLELLCRLRNAREAHQVARHQSDLSLRCRLLQGLQGSVCTLG